MGLLVGGAVHDGRGLLYVPKSMMELPTKLRKALRKVADPHKAPAMQAYMKSSMPYLGVQTTDLRRVCKQIFADIELTSAEQWELLVRELWKNARYREERYAAISLLEDKRALPFHSVRTLALFEELIVDGAWWDYVDVIASHRVGYLLAKYPIPIRRKMLSWSKSKSMWKRRTAILCQLSFKEKTDVAFLYECIAPSLASKEFFLQKAIGWALRQYAWTNPAEVKRYVKAQGSSLSALSRREALKNLK
jgi:3-methyladenine DNA glycosylase AlkD